MMPGQGWCRTAPRRTASVFIRPGLSPAATSRAAAVSGPTPVAANNAGFALAQRRRMSLSSWVISALRVWYRRARWRRAFFAYAAVVCAWPGRQRAQTATRALRLRPLSWCFTGSGAPTITEWIWLAAWVRALVAQRRATNSIRRALNRPITRFGNSGCLPASSRPGWCLSVDAVRLAALLAA